MRMLILSGKKALTAQIGEVLEVEQALKTFIKERKEYQIHFIYYDQNNPFNIPKSKRTAPAIRQFIQNVEKKWGKIEFLLLVGGDEIIPFFRLDNPCDDNDEVVLSDNPYASRDKDDLIPERVCARIPDNSDRDFMINLLNKPLDDTDESFGISTQVWKKASQEVFRHIGDPEKLYFSPPVKKKSFKKNWLENKKFLYFNLHGSKQSGNWYGQDKGSYPIALGVAKIDNAAGVVGAECCYGAYIINKSDKDSLALKFLKQRNIYGFCGSTTIAYGPVAPPSSEADLLMKYFFQYIQQGLSLGESLKNAKTDFARKILRRQGFLDSDDKKTLLQFVLYGDPTIRFNFPRKEGLHA